MHVCVFTYFFSLLLGGLPVYGVYDSFVDYPNDDNNNIIIIMVY